MRNSDDSPAMRKHTSLNGRRREDELNENVTNEKIDKDKVKVRLHVCT